MLATDMQNSNKSRVLYNGLKLSTHSNVTSIPVLQQGLGELVLVGIGLCDLHKLKFQELTLLNYL